MGSDMAGRLGCRKIDTNIENRLMGMAGRRKERVGYMEGVT